MKLKLQWSEQFKKMNYRITFYLQGEICLLKHIGTHDILNRQ